MKINDKSERRYDLMTLKVGECFKDECGEIYIKTDKRDSDDNMILCVSLKFGEVKYLCDDESIEHLPNACINIEG